MDKIDTVLVAFSATSIHKKLAMRALDVAEQNNAKLIILSVRDKKVAEKVAKMTKNHGFLGEKLIENLKTEIVKDRNELISKKLSLIESEAKNRGILFKIIERKGDFLDNIVKIEKQYNSDIILIGDVGKIGKKLKTLSSNEVLIIK